MSDQPPQVARRDLSALRIDRASDAPRPSSRLPWALVVLVVLVAASAVGLRFLTRSSLFAPEVAVVSATLSRPDSGARSLLTASGYVVARTKASVSARLAGRLEELLVEEGSVVVAGQVLARLDADDLEAEVAFERAHLAEADAALRRAQAERDLAQVDARRQAELLKAGVGTSNATEAASATLRSREAALVEAEAAVRSARARLARAEVEVEKSYVRAPFDGVVLRKEAEVGESVAPAVAAGQLTRGAIITMADLADLEVETDVSESNIGRVVEGQSAEVAVDAVPEKRYRGRVRQVMPTADRQKATVQVDVSIVDADIRVKPEMGAKVTFLSGEPDAAALAKPPVLTLPRGCVVAGRDAVFVVEDGHARLRRVVLGGDNDGRVVVSEGLTESESVILDPPEDLRDGGVVKVRKS